MVRRSFFVFLAIALTATGVIASGAVDLSQGDAPRGEVRSAPGHPATEGPDPAVVFEQMARDHQRLVAERAAPTAVPGIFVELTQQDRIDIGLAPCTDCSQLEMSERRRRVGVVKSVADVDFRGLSPVQVTDNASFAGGQLRATADGFVWTLVAEAPGAVAQRFNFEYFDLPAGAEAWVYGDSGEAFGPYTGFGRHEDGQFWSESIHGESAYIQVHYSGPLDPYALNDVRFMVPEVAFMGDISEDPDGGDVAPANHCGNASCVLDGAGGFNALSDATGHMRWIAGAFLYICSGGLIADTDPSFERPLFLTANHCLSRNKDARNLEVYFNYTSGCSPSGSPRTVGSAILATGNSGDFTLLELDESPPNGTGYLGWTAAQVATSDGTSLRRVHHPGGASQSNSSHSVDSSPPGICQGIPIPQWIYSQDTAGATEGGSSGSVVTNSSNQIVGQLTGACGFNTGNPCDAESNRTIDGALAGYFSNVSEFLDPTPCNPSPEVCDDGTDNDCDGDTDCADSDCSGDPACAGGGCTLGQPGDSCSSDSECCSNKCKGPPGNQTCR